MRVDRRVLPLTFAAVFAVVACQPAPEMAGDAVDTTEMAGADADADAATAAVDDVRSSWLSAAETDDAAAVAALYTEDATYVTPDGQVLEGRQAIQQALSQSLPMMSDLEITSSRDPMVSGDLAVDVGEYSSTMAAQGGDGMEADGFYTVVLRRQADGSWKIVSHLAAQPVEMPGG